MFSKFSGSRDYGKTHIQLLGVWKKPENPETVKNRKPIQTLKCIYINSTLTAHLPIVCIGFLHLTLTYAMSYYSETCPSRKQQTIHLTASLVHEYFYAHLY